MANDKQPIRPYSFLLVQVNRIADAAWIFAGLFLLNRQHGGWTEDAGWLAFMALVLFALISQLNHLYRPWRVAPLHEELSVLWRSWFTTLLIVVLVLYLFTDLFQLDKRTVLLWLIVTPLLLFATRVVIRLGLRLFRRSGRNFRTAAVVGMNEIGHRVADRILFNRWMGVHLLGYFDERAPDQERLTIDGPVPLIGDIDELVRMALEGEVDIVYIALPMRAETRIKELIERLGETLVSVNFVTDFAVFDFLHAQWETLSEMPVLRVIDSPFNGFNGVAKRLQDVLLASVMLALLCVPMLVIAAAIRLTSQGPALQRQLRHGLDGHAFTIYKFRTHRLRDKDEAGEAGDSALTPLGDFLQRTSFDELPQLINVLQGRMSMVGPRPHPLKYKSDHATLVQRFLLRHKVRPGITGWEQVNGVHDEPGALDKMRSRVEYDLEYINNWSFWFDLRILTLTLVRLWRGRKAT